MGGTADAEIKVLCAGNPELEWVSMITALHAIGVTRICRDDSFVWHFVLCSPGMSGVKGVALREASYINKSLSALADVLGALAEHRGHVPYRNSRLTHFLQDSIGQC